MVDLCLAYIYAHACLGDLDLDFENICKVCPTCFPVLMALTYWLRQRYAMFAWTAGAAALIFRIETLIFLGLFVLGDLLRGRFGAIFQVVKNAIPAAVVLLGMT